MFRSLKTLILATGLALGLGAPALAQKVEVPVGAKIAPNVGAKLDINGATEAQLMKVKGIGKVKAKLIKEGGPYKNIDEVLKVKGVGKKTLDLIKEQFEVLQPPSATPPKPTK